MGGCARSEWCNPYACWQLLCSPSSHQWSYIHQSIMGVLGDSHIHNVTTCNPPLVFLGDDAGVFVFHQWMTGHVRNLVYIYIFIGGGDICGRYADDARLIQASVNAPTSVAGFSFQTPQAYGHLDLWVTFLPGEQGLHFDTKPCCFGTTQTTPSCLVKYPPHAVLVWCTPMWGTK